MINVVARTSNILNPCQLSDNDRVQAFISSDIQQYTNGGQMQFSVPSKEILDMSESYIDYDITPINPSPEGEEVYTIHSHPAGSTAGTFNLLFGGVVSTPLAFNSTPTDIANALTSMSSIYGRGYKVNVSGGSPSASNVTIRFCNFDIAGGPPSQVSGPLSIINSNAFAGADNGTYNLTFTAGSLSTPRIERFSPLFDYIYVQINNETVYNLTDAQILESALDQLDNELYRERGFYDGVQYESGVGFYRNTYAQSVGGSPAVVSTLITRRLRYGLHNIELFKKILPLELLTNPQFRIYLHIDNASRTLICSQPDNSANQAIQLSNPKLHYHKLQLVPSERQRLYDMINSAEGLVIPFRNWHNFHTQINQGSNNATIIFNPSQSGFLGLYFVLWDTLYASNATNRRKLSTFLKSNIGSFRLKSGSSYWPLDAIRSDVNGESYAQMISNLIQFTEIVKLRRMGGDMFAMPAYSVTHTNDPVAAVTFKNLAGPYAGQGVDAHDYYIDEFGNSRLQTCIMAISTSDMGYDEQSQLCVRASMNGIDTSALANVSLELYDITINAPIQCDIFYLSQDYLIFKNDTFTWKH